MAQASFVEIDGVYHPTIKDSSGERILEEDGRKLEFDSAVRAVAAAARSIRESLQSIGAIEEQLEADYMSATVAAWAAARAVEVQRSRDLFALRNVKVVRRRRRST